MIHLSSAFCRLLPCSVQVSTDVGQVKAQEAHILDQDWYPVQRAPDLSFLPLVIESPCMIEGLGIGFDNGLEVWIDLDIA